MKTLLGIVAILIVIKIAGVIRVSIMNHFYNK